MTADVVARRVRVHGRVQGVFFRDSCRRRAESMNVAGWVRNEPDGSVTAHFEGDASAVEDMVAWSRQGPPGAAVTRVDVTETVAGGLAGFDVRR